jgi:WD40 repeat protein/serine/threonine protein kinase
MADKSSDSSANYVLLTRLADEFAARYRAGEQPALQEYIDRYPEMADDIRDLLPAMVEIEQVKEDHEQVPEHESMPPAPALQQLGDFRIIRVVGKGGMGIVYEAEQMSLGRHVALKVLPKNMLLDARAKRRFEREAKAAAKLHHTNIVPVFGVGEHDGMPYYVMQFIQGLGLDEVLEELKKLKLTQVKTGTFGGSEVRVSRKVEQTSNPHEEGQPVKNLPSGELSAVNVARSLLTGEFEGTRDVPHEDDALPEPEIVTGRGDPPTPPPSEGGDRGGNRSPAPSDSFTPLSSSAVLPGRGRDGSRSRNRKHTYWQSVASIGAQVAEALEYAHKQGIQHRDIKPSNLLLDATGTVWVTDFGLAKADDQQNLTHTGDVLGTLRYMPPEAFEGKTDGRSDVYSLGLTLYEMLAFRPAFDEKERNRLIKQVTYEEPARLGKLNRQVPRDLETIVQKAIDKDPSRRYASSGALAEDLQRFIEDEPIQARRVSPAERWWRWCRHNPLLATTMGLAAAALLAVTIVSSFLAVAQANLAAQRARSNDELRQEQERTQAALEESKQLSRELDAKLYELRKNSAWAAAERGQSLIEQGQLHGGLLWLTRGLELAPAQEVDLQQVLRSSMASFRGEFPILRATFPHALPNYLMSISPDGKTLAIGGSDFSTRKGDAQLWDLASGKRIGPLLEHQSIRTLAFSPDSKTLLTGSFDGAARLWDVATGRPVEKSPINHGSNLLAVAFSPDGKTIVTAGFGDDVRLWDAATGQPRAQKLRHPGMVSAVAFSPDGKSLLTAGASTSNGGDTSLWDLSAGTARRFHFAQVVWAVVFSPDGKTFATGESNGTVRLWDVATGQSVGNTLDHQNAVYSVAFSPDGRTLLTAGGGVVRLWDRNTGEAQGEPFEGTSSVFSSAWYSPDGQSILVPGPDQTVRRWSLPAGRQTRPPLPQPGVVVHVEYSREGKNLFVESGDGKNLFVESGNGSHSEVRLWDAALGRAIGPSLKYQEGAHLAALGPDGKTVVMVAGGTGRNATRSFRLWDAVVGKPRVELIPALAYPQCVAFSPNGKTVLFAGWEITGRVRAQQRDATTGNAIGLPLLLPGLVHSVAFSSDGKLIATGSRNNSMQAGEVRLWDAQTGKSTLIEMRHRQAVVAVAFSPDDKILLSGSADRTARLWDTATGKPIGLPLLHHGAINAVAFSPDGKIAATASDDKTVRLWMVPAGMPLGPPLRHPAAVKTVAFSPDGTTLVTGGADRMLHFWPVPRPLSGDVDQIKAAVEVATGKTIGPDSVTTSLEASAWQARLDQLARGARQLPDSPNPFVLAAGMGLSWHQRQALDCLTAEKWQAALWHLDHQLSATPDDWLSLVLRTEANKELDRGDAAATDLAKAFTVGPPEQVLSWYRCFAAERADKEQWQTAFWYLDHLLAARPNSADVYVQRARAYVKRNSWKEAAADYAKAAEVSPGDPQLWLEKAHFDFGRGQLQDAAKAFAAAFDLHAGDHWSWYTGAAVQLYIGDLDGYQRHCRAMLRRFGQTEDPAIAERTAKACLLLPDAVEDQKLVQQLAERAVTNTDKHNYYPFFMLAKGFAEYRAGHPEQAIDWLRKSLKSPDISEPAYSTLAQLFLAMAYHRLGRPDEAGQALAQARAAIAAERENWKRDNAAKGNADWLRAMSVLPEAESLIEGKPR